MVAQQRAEAGSTLQQRILLVDDDDDLVSVMTELLSAEGYAVIVGRTVAEAEGMLSRRRVELVLTDGFSNTPAEMMTATAGIIRAAGATPVALFTAHRMEGVDLLAAGFRDVITKPFELDVLIRQLQALLNSHDPSHPDPIWTTEGGTPRDASRAAG
jgi:two-component system OmpR family response regulator